jgi:predicted DsbA family dithiol-disulfide isomerase
MACLAVGELKALVERYLQADMVSGVSSTPTFYINGALLVGGQPSNEFEQIIDSELAEAGASLTSACAVKRRWSTAGANPARELVRSTR